MDVEVKAVIENSFLKRLILSISDAYLFPQPGDSRQRYCFGSAVFVCFFVTVFAGIATMRETVTTSVVKLLEQTVSGSRNVPLNLSDDSTMQWGAGRGLKRLMPLVLANLRQLRCSCCLSVTKMYSEETSMMCGWSYAGCDRFNNCWTLNTDPCSFLGIRVLSDVFTTVALAVYIHIPKCARPTSNSCRSTCWFVEDRRKRWVALSSWAATFRSRRPPCTAPRGQTPLKGYDPLLSACIQTAKTRTWVYNFQWRADCFVSFLLPLRHRKFASVCASNHSRRFCSSLLKARTGARRLKTSSRAGAVDHWDIDVRSNTAAARRVASRGFTWIIHTVTQFTEYRTTHVSCQSRKHGV